MDTPFSLPTPPTLEQRLDAAAEEFRAIVTLAGATSWSDLHRAVKAGYRRRVESVCRAFAPEHFKDTDKVSSNATEER